MNCSSVTVPVTCGHPRSSRLEALRNELAYFVKCILDDKPRSTTAWPD